jgi:uncharacterized membrane protein YfcA
MQIYLPIAEMTVPVESILALGVAVGFLSGVFGVGGGFLTTPFLIFFGIPPAIAVGTQANQLIAASFSGILGHLKRGNVDFKLGAVMFGGSLVGSVLGILIFRLLQHTGQIDFVISALYIVLLGAMGLMMLYESLRAVLKNKIEDGETSKLQHHPFFLALPYKIRFMRSRLYISALIPAGIGLVGGLLVAIMGIGGGFILVPLMIYVLGMPTLLVAGTSLFHIMLTSIFTTLLHAIANNTVDIVLAFMLIIGGVVGAQIGTRAARKIRGAYARVLLSALLLLVCCFLMGELFIGPLDIYHTEVR